MNIEREHTPSELEAENSTNSRLTVVLPRETYDKLAHLALERKIVREGLEPQHTNAITGEQHPLHNSGRGIH